MRHHFSELPVLGIGLAADVAGILPNYRNFINKEYDFIDYLSFGAHYSQKNRIAHYISDLIEDKYPILFHPVNFNVASPEPEDPAISKAIVEIAKYTSAVWTGQDIGIWTYGRQYLGGFLLPAVMDDISVEQVVAKVKHINDLMPSPFLVENPPVSYSLETMHVIDFMREVSTKADCGIVLDVGHLIGYQQSTGRELDALPLDRFPFERVIEVHMAGLQFSQVGETLNILDQHAYPVHEMCWEFLGANIEKMTSLKAITLEQEFCEDSLVLEHLRKARTIAESCGVFDNAS